MAAPVLDRRGFTLIELLVSLVVGGLLAGMVLQLLQGQTRFLEVQGAREEVQQNARAVLELIGSELRTVPGAGGLEVAEAERLRMRVPRVWGVVCGVSGADVEVVVPTVEGLSLVPSGGTRAVIDTGPAGSSDWSAPQAVQVEPPQPTDCAGEALDPAIQHRRTFRFAALPTGVRGGAPPAPGSRVYLYDVVGYELGTSSGIGGTWIHRRLGTAAPQPLAGPVPGAAPHPAGLRFRYFQGVPATEVAAPVPAGMLDAITQVRVQVTTISRLQDPLQMQTDTVVIVLRNRIP